MSRTAARPLDSDAVTAADNDFYSNHPELLNENGNRIPLSANDPAQAKLRIEWMNHYVANGGKLAGKGDSLDGNEEEDDPPKPVEDCPLKDDDNPKPTIKAKWSKPSVLPDHNSGRPPASPPTDTIPNNAKVQMIVETTEVPDGTSASITIHHCVNDGQIEDGDIQDLEISSNKVVDPETGDAPEFVFDAKHNPWDYWDSPYFYFKVQVDYQGLSEETPKDFNAQEDDCLRITYWHVCFSDSTDLTGVQPEANNVNGILNGVADSTSSAEDYKAVNTALNVYGSHLRNTYVFHQASHGNAINRTTNASISSATSSMPPDDVANPADWRSIVHFTPLPRFCDQAIQNNGSVPSVPRYLYYSSTCLTGWESSFADALIARGCRNVIAFRVTIPDSEAPKFANKFYTKWANDYKLDPEKIPDCFFEYASDHYDNMRPVLFGSGGGQASDGSLSSSEVAAIAVASVVAGVLVGVAVYALLQ